MQWGIVYVAGAWGFLQGLEYLSGTYDWPRQIQQLVTLALLIGLPIVLVLAWYHGDRDLQLCQARQALELQADTLLASRPDYQRLRSLPGVGPIIALVVLAEAGDQRRPHRQDGKGALCVD